jgi:hypothetical protein
LEERVAIFIDGSNFYHGLKNLLDTAKIDFLKLAKNSVLAGNLLGSIITMCPLIRRMEKTDIAANRNFSQN